MSRQDRLQRILTSLHETVLDDTRWPATSALIDEACGVKGSCLGFSHGLSLQAGEILFGWLCFRGERQPELERLYLEVYHPLDERIGRIGGLPDSQLVHVSSLYSDEEKRNSRFYNEGLPLYKAQNSINARLDGPSDSQIVWIVVGPVKGGGWSSAQVEKIKTLLPHLRQFVRIRQALVDANAHGASLAKLLENARTGIIQLDRRGKIVTANDHARELLRTGDGLVDRHGLPQASLPADDVQLQKLLARALPPFGGQSAAGSTMLTRWLLSPRLVLHILPTSEGHSDRRPRHVAALVLVADPAPRALIDPGLVADALGLTPSESQVAVSLAQGNTVRDIPIATGRSESTIRWHIKQILGKHDITRQVQLAHLVLALAEVAASPR